MRSFALQSVQSVQFARCEFARRLILVAAFLALPRHFHGHEPAAALEPLVCTIRIGAPETQLADVEVSVPTAGRSSSS